jgi:hypothetical protein
LAFLHGKLSSLRLARWSGAKQPPRSEEKEQGSRRAFPHHSLEAALPLPQVIADEMAGQPINRLLLAEALEIKPSSSNFRDLLSSAYKYGLTNGTEKAEFIGLTDIGKAATQDIDPTARIQAL